MSDKKTAFVKIRVSPQTKEKIQKHFKGDFSKTIRNLLDKTLTDYEISQQKQKTCWRCKGFLSLKI